MSANAGTDLPKKGLSVSSNRNLGEGKVSPPMSGCRPKLSGRGDPFEVECFVAVVTVAYLTW